MAATPLSPPTTTTSIRLTASEREVLAAAAVAHGTTVGAIVKKAAFKLAEHMGATPPDAMPRNTRKKNTVALNVRLSTDELAALADYSARCGYGSNLALAGRCAIRALLAERADIIMPAGQDPDADPEADYSTLPRQALAPITAPTHPAPPSASE